MATLERTRDSTSTTTAVERDGVSLASTAYQAPSGPVPAAFPEQQRERGRPPLSVDQRADSYSRSPNGTRRSLSKIGDRIKRAVSQARDSSIGSAGGDHERGRRLSEVHGNTKEEETRGRSSTSARNSVGSTTNQNVSAPLAPSQYRLSASQTRSSSVPRTIGSMSSTGGKIVSTGRGGAGNLIGFATAEEPYDLQGNEDADLVKQIREDRSKSREREGRTEVAVSGRGGRGNIRSSSRGRDLELGRVPTVMEEQERADREDEVLRAEEIRKREDREKASAQPQRWVSSGRGGAGNFHVRQPGS